MRDDTALLLDILLAARKVQRFTKDMAREDFNMDEMAQSAVIRELQVIGEATRLLSNTTRDTISEIEWQAIAGMRNRLVHEYFSIRLDVVWETIRTDIPPLIAAIEVHIPPEDK